MSIVSNLRQESSPVQRTVQGLLAYCSPLTVLALVPSALIISLLLLDLWTSVRTTIIGGRFTLVHYQTLFGDAFVQEAILNTAVFAFTALVIAMTVGIAIAWIVERTDFSGKRFVYSALTLGVLIPGFFTAMGWLFLLHPRSGILNRFLVKAFHLSAAPFNITTPVGMGIVQGIGIVPVVFVIMVSAIRAMDSSLEEAAQMSGAGFWNSLRRITLPLLSPAIMGAGFYVLMIAISAFDVPAVLGRVNRVFTFSTFLALRVNPAEGLPQYGVAGAASAVMIIFALAVSWRYTRLLIKARQFQIVTGKSYRTRPIALGRWKGFAWTFVLGYVVLSQFMPFVLLVWDSLLPYLQPPSLRAFSLISLGNFERLPWTLINRGLPHSLILAVSAPTLAMLASFLFSWVVLRTKSRMRMVFEFIAFLPHAVPSVIFGVAALVASLYLSGTLVNLYGSLLVLIIVMAVTQISFGTRITNTALIQLHSDLEEAAYVSGASLWTVIWRIILPLIRHAFTYGWLWLCMLTLRELTLGILLMSPDNLTLPAVIFRLLATGASGQASATAILMLAVMVPPVVVYLRTSGVGSLNQNMNP